MVDLLDDANRLIVIFDGSLVIGNHDSITLLGTQSQMKLRDYSRTVSKLFQTNNDELEKMIENVLYGIDRFEACAKKKKHSFLKHHNRYKEITKEYKKISIYIERVSMFFQLQQAQLLKEIKLLEKLSVTVGESAAALEDCIKLGKQVLCNRPVSIETNDNHQSKKNDNCYAEDVEVWYSRLERRIDDLCISHTVALQNQTQISILKENNLALLDRISATISNTFPIWQNQMAMLLGIERLEKRINEQNRVIVSADSTARDMYFDKEPCQKAQQIDAEGMVAFNSKLKDALSETVILEKQDINVRKTFNEKMI